MDRKYSIPDVIKALAHKYEFSPEENDAAERIRKKLPAVCEKIMVGIESGEKNLWEASIVPKGQRPDHWFTENELQRLLTDLKLEAYIMKNIWDEARFEKYIERKKEVDALAAEARKKNEQYYKYLSEFNPAKYYSELSEGLVGPSAEDISSKKLQTMIEAIFSQSFKSFNSELLALDMWEAATVNEGEETVESMEARKRLNEPVKSYCEPKETDIGGK